MAPELPNSNNMEETVAHDSVDIFLGAFYQHGIPLIGEIPQKELVQSKFFPFYGEELRKIRLNMLIPRIEKYHKRIEVLIEQKNFDIFIWKRQYPVNLQKHLYYQLAKILNLPQEEIKKLLFVGDKDLFKLASNYLQVANNYLDKYKKC